MAMKKLQPEEEVDYLFEIHGGSAPARLLDAATSSYDVLQSRSQMLLSLVAVILTIAGFSGPTIARSSFLSQCGVAVGLAFVLLAAVVVLFGPLQLRWATQWKADTLRDSLIVLVRRRNSRTCAYHVAFILLTVGLACYVMATVAFLFGV
jgi:hypothetical protein